MSRKKKTGKKTEPRPAPVALEGVPPAEVAPGPLEPGRERRSKRLVLIDVENASNETQLIALLESLHIDRSAQATEIHALGNWRLASTHVARRLASLGVSLLHTAPAAGVRDWSDLRLAVTAGCWLAEAMPGDQMEILSNDQAFDAVGDVAAARGVAFRRIQHAAGGGAARRGGAPRGGTPRGGTPPSGTPPSGSTRANRDRAGAETPQVGHASSPAPSASRPAPAAQQEVAPREPHGASRDQLIATIRDLSGDSPGRWLQLDAVGEALKARGFSRPPGSPRLVTRLRLLKELEVSAAGRVRIRPR
ncbi:MAG: hypothetical protein HYX75_04570 [Acidobacteria bacterium]|nr:hypothetical protein [Acidobacteriota bacterium]